MAETSGKEQKKRSSAGAIWAVLLPILLNGVLTFYLIEYINNPKIFEKMTMPFHFLGWIITALIYFILVFALNSVSVGMTIGNWFFFIWACANYFVADFRGVPLQWVDLGSVRTAMNVAGNYTLAPTRQMGISLLFTAALTFFYLRAGIWHNFHRLRGKLLSRALSAAAIFLFWAVFLHSDFFASAMQMQPSGWAPQSSYASYGMEACFLDFARMSFPRAPESYSKKHVEEIIDDAGEHPFSHEENENNIPENIIFIMDESFADFTIYPHFQADQDVMPFLNSMKENAQQGRMLVSVKGGNTANTEYEALTGNSCVLAPTIVAYNSFIKEDQFSLARVLKAQGYKTVALHPFWRNGWNRPVVYERMGFDEFRSLNDSFQGAETVRSYVSDEADFQALIDCVEQKEAGQKLFLFNVTMQNHGSYSDENFSATVHVPDFNGESKRAAEQYLTLAKMSDEALQNLVGYFSQSDEKTMIVFWGDHQPMIGDDFWEYCFGVDDLDDLSFAQREMMYETRYFIWTNYATPEENGEFLSSNYISSYALSLTGLSMSAYQKYLLSRRSILPAMNAYGYLGTDGSMHEWGSSDTGTSESEALDRYENLIYNELTAGRDRDASFFGLPD